MIFNSFQFAVFFIIIYCLYLVLNHKLQNRMLLAASYIFYSAWNWRFLSLILITTILHYICGLRIHKSASDRERKSFLFLGIFASLSILGVFKYFNYFITSLESLLGHFGFPVHMRFLNIALPLGISFYTFQTLSYTIDIYRKKMEPTRNYFDFSVFVAFFPLLLAGPIERARHLLPQIISPRKPTLNKFYEGSYLIFYGLFQKMFVADNLSRL